jgi:MFS superfamily sulfate permease-like transporter
VIVGVEQAILLAIVLSMITHLRHGYRPQNTLLTRGADGHIQPRPVDSVVQLHPGLMVYGFSHGVYYANAEQLTEQVLDLVKKADPPLRWFCFDGLAVHDVDYTAGMTLVQLQGDLKDHGVRLVMVSITDHVRAELDRDGLVKLIGEDGLFEYVSDLLESFQRQPERSPVAAPSASPAPPEPSE